MSKAQQMRDKLANIAEKSRTEFEMKKRDLEAEMAKGRANMFNIKKGLKNNEIIDQPFANDMGITPMDSFSNQHTPKKNLTRSTTKKFNNGVGGGRMGEHTPSASQINIISPSHNVDPSILMPTGLRVSDWCFTGSYDSMPPIVKINNVYENVRPLGRGTFGDVYLVKNVDDNKL